MASSALACLCIACAGNGQVAPVQGTTPAVVDPQPTRASLIAQTLVEAESAYTSNNMQRLAELLAKLNASGLRPMGENKADTIAMWTRASGTQTPPFRGRLLGPAYVRGELAPGEVWRSAQTFKSGETSTVSVSHKGNGPVRMTISDNQARAVCNPSQMSNPACRFTPVFTQRYNIELRNDGAASTVYFLVLD